MSQPNNYEEYLARTKENTKITGFGLGEVHMDYPCPFCAAADWMKSELMDTQTEMQKEHVCVDCGRSAKFIFEERGAVLGFELVQTGGDPQPEYFTVKARRVDVN